MAANIVGFISPNLVDLLINKIEEVSTYQLKVLNIMVENEIYRRRVIFAIKTARSMNLSTMPHMAKRVSQLEAILQCKNPVEHPAAIESIEELEIFLNLDEDSFKLQQAA